MKRLFNIGFLMILLFCAYAESQAQSWVARHGLTSAQYQSEFNTYVNQGFRLTYVSGYAVNDEARYAAIWEKKAGPAWVARHGMTSAVYQSEFNKYVSQGYRLSLVNGYTVNDEARYAAIWEKKSGPAWVARHGLTSAQYQSEFNTYVGQGYRLTHVSGYAVNDEARYAAIWEKKAGPSWVARHGMTSAVYQSEFNKYVGQGYRLTHVSGYTVDDEGRYAAIWEKSSVAAWVARHGMDSAVYQKEFDHYSGCQGFKLKLVSGYSIDDKGRYAAIWERSGPPPALAPPEAPTNVYVSNQGDWKRSLKITWKDNSKCEEGFKIYMTINGNINHQVASLGRDVQEYVVDDLGPGHTYCFKVEAWNHGGATKSAESCGTTKAEPSDNPEDPPAPSKPTMKLRAYTTQATISKITSVTFDLKGPNGFTKAVAASQQTSKSRQAIVTDFSGSPVGTWEVKCVVKFEYNDGSVVHQGTLNKTFSEKWAAGKLVIWEYKIEKDGAGVGAYVLKATQ